jgi:hypothetical protein
MLALDMEGGARRGGYEKPSQFPSQAMNLRKSDKFTTIRYFSGRNGHMASGQVPD